METSSTHCLRLQLMASALQQQTRSTAFFWALRPKEVQMFSRAFQAGRIVWTGGVAAVIYLTIILVPVPFHLLCCFKGFYVD